MRNRSMENKSMNRKYIKRSSSINQDYWYYLAQENIYTVLFGHKPEGYKKATYIWKALLRYTNEYRKVISKG